MPKNTIEITSEMERVLNKVRSENGRENGKKITNERAIEIALLKYDKLSDIFLTILNKESEHNLDIPSILSSDFIEAERIIKFNT